MWAFEYSLTCNIHSCQAGEGEHDYSAKKRRYMVQNTKKCNCTAQIHMREIIAYPGYKVRIDY